MAKWRKKGKIIHISVAILVFLALTIIPLLVLLDGLDISAKVLSGILLILVIMLGFERIYVLLKTNEVYRIW